MSTTDADTGSVAEQEQTNEQAKDGAAGTDQEQTEQEAEPEAGKLPDEIWAQLPDEAKGLIKSLQANRGDAAKYRTQLREVEQSVEQLNTKVKEAEDARAQALADNEATSVKVKQDLLKARVEAAAAAALKHPSDALKLLDWDDVDADDPVAISNNIKGLVESRPDLAKSTITPTPRGAQADTGNKSSWAREIG